MTAGRLIAAASFMLLIAATRPPDYREAVNWMFRDTGGTAQAADVFYVHPTTARTPLANQPPGDVAVDRWTDLSVGVRQVSAFACCRRFAPRYRQATMGALGKPAADRDHAFDVAYDDVRTAFRLYAAVDNGGRPFILAGHSQGSRHALRLLREEIAGTPLAARLVAAYLPGIGLPMAALPLPACATPGQTGCIVSWNSFAPDADVAPFVARSLASYGQGRTTGRILCVNPVSFAIDRPRTDFAAAKGALAGPAQAGPLPPARPARVAANCDGDVLRVITRDGLPVERLSGGNLHMADIALFWADIRRNAQQRVAAYRRRR